MKFWYQTGHEKEKNTLFTEMMNLQAQEAKIISTLTGAIVLNKGRPLIKLSELRERINVSSIRHIMDVQEMPSDSFFRTTHRTGLLYWLSTKSGITRGSFSTNMNSLCTFSSTIKDKSTVSLLSMQTHRSPEFTHLKLKHFKRNFILIDWRSLFTAIETKNSK